MSEPIHCDSCNIDHNDPKLHSFSDVSIDIVGNTKLCPIYARWIQEALIHGYDVTIRFLEARHTLVIKGQCNCLQTKTDGESEHWPDCRYV